MNGVWRWATAALLITSGAGCRSTGWPNWLNPGSSENQQAQAQQYDPYPEDDIGHSNESMRPPGFERSQAEVKRARPWSE